MLLDMGLFRFTFPLSSWDRVEVVSLLQQLACIIHLSVTDKTSLTTFIAELQRNGYDSRMFCFKGIFLLFIINLLFIIYYLLFIIYYLLFIIYYLLLYGYWALGVAKSLGSG